MKTNKILAASGAIVGVLALVSLFYEEQTIKELEQRVSRALSINLGNGACEWVAPIYDVPADKEFTKTIITGYPGADKRMVFIQLEALTGLSARDEWDFAHLGMTNQPFIKANYPHHEGIWGWQDAGDQVLMTVRNMRRSLVEYHDILWDIGYAKTFDEAFLLIPNLFQERPPLADFLNWRDERVMDEIHWYGWFIDYWMEEGLMRDMFNHKITTPEHWYMLMEPTGYTKAEMAYDLIVGNETVVTPSYDPHCVNDVSGGCYPIAIISVERLVTTDRGPAEGIKIAEVLRNNTGMDEYLIDEEAWGCIWDELIVKKRGLKTFVDRPHAEDDYNFSAEMLGEMLHESDRLIAKYGAPEWISRPNVPYLLELLTEYRGSIAAELVEVQDGTRVLRATDFLGHTTRKRMEGISSTSSKSREVFELKMALNQEEKEDNKIKKKMGGRVRRAQ